MLAGWDLYDTDLAHMFAYGSEICTIRVLHILQRKVYARRPTNVDDLDRDVFDV